MYAKEIEVKAIKDD